MEWTSVDNGYPEDWVYALCYCNDIVSSWYEVLHWDEKAMEWVDQDDRIVPYIVTHWMIPDQPKD